MPGCIGCKDIVIRTGISIIIEVIKGIVLIPLVGEVSPDREV